jgi:hypothetical protein
MAMSEELLKVELSPGTGQLFGTFSEGQPVAEAIGQVIAFQIDGKEGERVRRYGQVSGVHDDLLNIDNKKGSMEQVVQTTIFFVNAPELVIKWRQIAVAVAEVAIQGQSPRG